MLLRRVRPLLHCAAAFAVLWSLAAYFRSDAVRVIAVRGSRTENSYAVSCRISNPSDKDVRIIANVSILGHKLTEEADLYVTLAQADRELTIPADSELPLTVEFEHTWSWIRLVEPLVVVRGAPQEQACTSTGQ